MRITTRTPPVRIAAADMVALAALPAEHAGLMLRWGMRRYADGFGVSIEEARAEASMDDRAWAVLIQLVRPLLDLEAFEAGKIVVEPFARAADSLAKVSASKVRAARIITMAATRAAGGVAHSNVTSSQAATTEAVPPSVAAKPVARPRAAPTPPVDAGPWEAFAGQMVTKGASLAEVQAAIPRWQSAHTIEDMIGAMETMADRRVAKPVKYLDTVLTNMVASRRATMPSTIRTANEGALLPRPVKRKIQVGPRSGWTFEGWTAKGHARGGDVVEERRQVWRNESGMLSYKRPDPDGDQTIPTYEEDPGVYEAD